MADNQVEEVKQKTDIVSIIGERIELKKAGRNYKANCPFHGEKTPSFIVSSELQIFKCFGCGIAGDSIAFLEKYEGMDFYEALKYLAERAGVKLKPIDGRNQSEKEKLYEINALAARFYNYILLNLPVGKTGLDYLTKERGLKIDTIKTFDLGFAPEKESALFDFLTKKKKYDVRDVELAGLVVRVGPRYFDRFRGRGIFPIFDSRGNVIALAGRILPQYEKKEIGKYINSPETPVYHKSASLYGINVTKSEIKRESVAVVVEGELDLISSYQAGIKNIVAIKGSSLTTDHVRILSRITTEIVLALDSDFAGEEASRRGIAHAYESGLNVRVATFRKYKDPDEYARHDKEGFKKILEKATSAWDFLINTIVSKYDSSTGEGKAKVSKEAIPVLAMITDKIVQAHYIALLASRINVSEEVVTGELNRHLSTQKAESPKLYSEDKSATITPRREILEDRLLSLIFENPQKHISEYASLLSSPFSRGIVSEYHNFVKSRKKFDLLVFVKTLPAELAGRFSELMLGIDDETTNVEKELKSVKVEIEATEIRGEMAELRKKISEFEDKGEDRQLVKAEKRFNELGMRLKKDV